MTSTEGLEHSEPPQNGFGSNTGAKESNSDIDNMFFGICTICDDKTSSVPTQSMLTTFPTNSTEKKKNRSKMVFISDFTEDDYGEKKDEHGNIDDYDHKSNDNNNSNHDNTFTVTSEVVFEKLDPSQLLLVQNVLEGMDHVHNFYIRSNHSNIHNDSNHMFEIEYNPNVVSISKILESFQDLGLKNTIQNTRATNNSDNSNGTVQSLSQHQQNGIQATSQGTSTTKCRSSFYVDGICCASEVPIVTSIIKTIPNKKQFIHKVSINITSRMVYVEYNPEFVTASDIHDALVQEGFEKSSIKHDGNVLFEKRRKKKDYYQWGEHQDSHNQMERENDMLEQKTRSNDTIKNNSNFVESILYSPLLTEDAIEVMNDIFFENNFLYDYIRSYTPNIACKTIKIEHNPKLISIENVVNVILADDSGKNSFDKCKILVDGFKEGLVLPSTSVVNCHQNVRDISQDDGGFRSKFPQSPLSRMKQYVFRLCRPFGIGTQHGLSINIILSGFFWILSITGHFTDNKMLQVMGLLAVILGLPPVAKKAYRTLKRRQFDANCMMVTAALGAVALQQFDEAASVSFLFAISEYLEDQATIKAKKALDDIIHLRPEHANYIDQNSGEIKIVPVNDLDIDDLVSVRMGDKIPTDGVVVEGFSQIDEASLTGESRPIDKGVGDVVSGGTINVGNTRLVVRATALVEDSAVSRLIRLVEESASNRSPTEQLVDAFARSYTPTVIFVAVLLCTIPWFWGVEMGRKWSLNGLIIIVIACPCALTISTPVTYAAGLAATAQKGIIVKGGAKLEALGKVKTIVFDKTGTLTEGKFRFIDLKLVGKKRTRREVLELLAIMEGPSSHPLAATLVHAAKEEGVYASTDVSVTDHSILKGEGVTAIVDGRETYVGNIRLFERLEMFSDLTNDERNLAAKWNHEGSTVGFIGIKDIGIIGMFSVADAVRDEAKSVVQALLRDGIKVFLLTGDGAGPAKAVASEVGIPQEYVRSQYLPEDKLHHVASMLNSSKQGTLFKKQELLLMCGDGVNDAPALAVADVGVAMGEGASLALEISDVTLMDSNLSKLLYSVKTGMKVILTVQENIAVSVAAKVIVIILTFMGKMSLLGAIASDVGVMLLVSINGMKLLPGGTGLSCKRRRKYGRVDLQQPMTDIV